MIGYFFRKDGPYAWARIPRPKQKAVQRSLGTSDEAMAKHICLFLESLKLSPSEQNDWLLSGMAEGRLPVQDVYAAYAQSRLSAYVSGIQQTATDPLLEPYVARWVKEMERRKRPSPRIRQKYERQVRTFVADTVRKSDLTRPKIRQWLQDLKVGQPNRYRAALSGFSEFLMLEEVIEFNPVRAVPASAENPPRDRHLIPADAERLVLAMPTERERAFQAFLIVTCADVESARQVRVADFDWTEQAAYLRGTKKVWRERWCYVTPTWAKLWAVVAAYVKGGGFLPQAQPFVGRDDVEWRSYVKVCVALEIDDYHMKDHRHTWIVQALKDKIGLHAVAQQAGHKDPTMILKVYGKHISRGDAYRQGQPAAPAERVG